MGQEGAIHLEVLLPAFVLGMVMKTVHKTGKEEENAAGFISYLFMFLVGLSTPLFVGIDTEAAGFHLPDWGTIALHVCAVTLLSNIGKMFPLFFTEIVIFLNDWHFLSVCLPGEKLGRELS